MSALNKFYPFVEALAEKVHNLQADQLKIALTNTAPVLSNAVLTDITEISYTNCSSRNITTSSSTQALGLYKLVLADITLTASGGSVGPFRYVVIYNDSAGSKNLIGFYDYGSSITLNTGENLVVDFDGTNGFLQIGG